MGWICRGCDGVGQLNQCYMKKRTKSQHRQGRHGREMHDQTEGPIWYSRPAFPLVQLETFLQYPDLTHEVNYSLCIQLVYGRISRVVGYGAEIFWENFAPSPP